MAVECVCRGGGGGGGLPYPLPPLGRSVKIYAKTTVDCSPDSSVPYMNAISYQSDQNGTESNQLTDVAVGLNDGW